MAYSIQRDVSNGSLQYLEVRIDYFAKEHLSVFIAEKVVPQGTTPDPVSGYCWTWDGNRIKFNKAVANGLEVMVRRATPIAAPFHIFRQGAVFKDLTVDENFLQQLYINQENQEGQTTTDFYSDLNFHGYRLRNVGAAIHDYDAVPFSQYRADALGAMQQRILAEQARDRSIAAETSAVASKDAASASAAAALASQNAAKTSETNAKNSEVAAKASENASASSATASANSAAASKADADRAKASADSIDPVLLNQKIDGAIGRVGALETRDTNVITPELIRLEVAKQGLVNGLNSQGLSITRFNTADDWNRTRSGEHYFTVIPELSVDKYVCMTRIGARDMANGATYIAISYSDSNYAWLGSAPMGGTPQWTRIGTNRTPTVETLWTGSFGTAGGITLSSRLRDGDMIGLYHANGNYLAWTTVAKIVQAYHCVTFGQGGYTNFFVGDDYQTLHTFKFTEGYPINNVYRIRYNQ